MTQPNLFIETLDPCRNRSRGNINSAQAYSKANVPHQMSEILRLLSTQDLTFKEMAAIQNVGLNTISGRAVTMRERGLIERTGERRGGSDVYRKCDEVPM
jgi:hypothetical protein